MFASIVNLISCPQRVLNLKITIQQRICYFNQNHLILKDLSSVHLHVVCARVISWFMVS